MELTIATEGRSSGRGARWGALLLSLSVVVACGGGGSSKAATKTTRFPAVPTTAFTGDPNRACGLATRSDVEAAIGAAVNPGQGANGVLCRYDLASSSSQSVLIESNETPEAANLYELKLSSAAGAEVVPGAGDEAFVAGNRVHVLRGTTLTVVTVTTNQPQAAVTAALKKLAQAVATHG